MKHTILLVEDDPDLAMVVQDLLEAEGASVTIAATGTEGLSLAGARPFDLLILDVMLPGMDGFEICRRVRQHGYTGAVLMLTARGQVVDRVTGLRTGADDYLVKPFAPDELAARVGALLRRVQRTAAAPLVSAFGSITADFERQYFTRNGEPIHLAGKEADLLRLFCQRSGEILSREDILQSVWRDQPHITIRTVDVYMAWLRGKLEEDPRSPRHFQTIRGEGYRFVR